MPKVTKKSVLNIKDDMTPDQKLEFHNLYTNATHDIVTDSAFTAEQKRDMVEKLPDITELEFYKFLKTKYQTASDISKYLKDRMKNRNG